MRKDALARGLSDFQVVWTGRVLRLRVRPRAAAVLPLQYGVPDRVRSLRGFIKCLRKRGNGGRRAYLQNVSAAGIDIASSTREPGSRARGRTHHWIQCDPTHSYAG